MPGSRKGPLASLGPLGVVAVCFVLPCMKGCNSAPVSPLAQIYEASNPLTQIGWVAPAFAIAALIASAILFTLALERIGQEPRKDDDGLSWRNYDLAVFGAMLAWIGSIPFFWLEMLGDHDEMSGTWLAVKGAVPITIGAFSLWRAWRASSWRRWTLLIGSYAAVAWGSPVTLLLLGAALHSPPRDILWGGWMYLSALAALAVIASVDVIRGWRSSS